MNAYQKAVALTYGGGDYAHFATDPEIQKNWEDEAANTGDTLFLFLMRDLADAESAEEAEGRVIGAQRDLDAAQCALSKLGE